MAAKKSASKRTAGKGRNKVKKVMHEYKHHQLRSGSGRKVTNPKQAIAIGLSEARESGANIPKKPARKKSAAHKTGGRKSTHRKTTVKKSAPRRKTTAKRR